MRLVICLLALLIPSAAWACGGLFCNNAMPVNQAAERILFAVDGDKMAMHVQITYQGPPSEFGWLLPVPDDVEVGLSSEQVFALLDQSFGPQFRLNRVRDDSCPQLDFESAAPNAAGGAEDGGVQVLSQAKVGPYEQATLKSASVMELRMWLEENDYQIPLDVDEKLEPYVSRGDAFVALKLRRGMDSGDIAPLRLTFRSDTPTIPIVPTSVAANPDMGIIAMVLGNHRAIPTNYKHVIINEAALDWAQQGRNYADVVSQAADEADRGHAFTTDFAGNHEGRATPEEISEETISALAELKDFSAAVPLLSDLIQVGPPNFVADPDLTRLVRSAITTGDDKTPDEVVQCLQCNRDDENITFDGEALAMQLRELNEVRKELKRLFDTLPYLTRLYGTMSPIEMDLDPTFSFNRDLETVDNIRTATMNISCGENGDVVSREIVTQSGLVIPVPQGDNPNLIERQNGETVRGMDMVGAAVIFQEMEAGEGEIQIDNREMLKSRFGADGNMMAGGAQAPSAGAQAPVAGAAASTGGAMVAATGGSDTAVNPTGAKTTSNDGGCDCDANRGGPASIVWLLLLAPMYLRRRRRNLLTIKSE